MAKKSKLNLINDDLTWNADRRYKVNSVVQLNGEDYQNITGKNSNPELLIDWQKIYTDIAISDVTGLPTALDDLQLNKEDKANKNIANGYAGLDSSGKIIPTQLPALAITDTFVVNSQAEMLALVAEVGDVAVRTDLNKSFILKVTGASTLANWQELLSPTSVDQTIIDGSTNAVSSNAVFDGLALKSNIGHTHVASQITDLSKASVGLGNVDNTSDLSKPLSTATINALATKAPVSGSANYIQNQNASAQSANMWINGRIAWGNSVDNSYMESSPTNGTNFVGKTGSTNDFVFHNGLGQGVIENPTGTQNVVFKGSATFSSSVTASPATTANQVVVKSQLDAVAARPYKVYTAFYTQQGTANPSFTVLENTIGSVSWSRTGTGTFVATSSNLFTLNKTFITTLSGTTNFIINASTFSSSDVWLNFLELTTGNLSDGVNTNKSFVEIRVYL